MVMVAAVDRCIGRLWPLAMPIGGTAITPVGLITKLASLIPTESYPNKGRSLRRAPFVGHLISKGPQNQTANPSEADAFRHRVTKDPSRLD